MLGGTSCVMLVWYLTLLSTGKFHMGITDCKLTKYEAGALLTWYWQVNTGVIWEKPVSAPLCPPQYPDALAWDRIRTSAVRVWRLTVRLQWHGLWWYAHIYGKGQKKIAKISFNVFFLDEIRTQFLPHLGQLPLCAVTSTDYIIFTVLLCICIFGGMFQSPQLAMSEAVRP